MVYSSHFLKYTVFPNLTQSPSRFREEKNKLCAWFYNPWGRMVLNCIKIVNLHPRGQIGKLRAVFAVHTVAYSLAVHPVLVLSPNTILLKTHF